MGGETVQIRGQNEKKKKKKKTTDGCTWVPGGGWRRSKRTSRPDSLWAGETEGDMSEASETKKKQKWAIEKKRSLTMQENCKVFYFIDPADGQKGGGPSRHVLQQAGGVPNLRVCRHLWIRVAHIGKRGRTANLRPAVVQSGRRGSAPPMSRTRKEDRGCPQL